LNDLDRQRGTEIHEVPTGHHTSLRDDSRLLRKVSVPSEVKHADVAVAVVVPPPEYNWGRHINCPY
jgi:hypothetical protein